MDKLTVHVFVLLCWYSVAVSAQCSPGCECPETNLMQCKALSAFPDQIPVSAEEVIFESCTFEIIQVLPVSYSNLQTLIIMNSAVMNITNGAFSNLMKLQILNLKGNHLQNLTPEMFSGLMKLDYLVLESNNINEITEGLFSNLPNLRKLSLEGNRELILKENSFKGYSLTLLNLDDCGLNEVPYLGEMKSLVILQLGTNPLSSLNENAFEGLSSLEKLELPSCQLTSIHEEAFENLEKLNSLVLSVNKLTSLEDHLFHDIVESLRELHLDHNSLETIEVRCPLSIAKSLSTLLNSENAN